MRRRRREFVNIPLTVQGALLATQEQWVEARPVSLAMVGLYKALGSGWESVYPLHTAGGEDKEFLSVAK